MKKLINDPKNVVRDSLEGLALAHPDILKVCFDPTYVIRAEAPVAGKVAIVSGGGSGHEPMHVARCSLLPHRTRSKLLRVRSIAASAFSTSSRTTLATL